ncbi:MAG: YggS family pyridoxal phosphate-dependent enzyme [Deltaproteobacteria bacterium]
MTPTERKIDENYRAVQARIAAVCRRTGRDPASVTLVAVTKYAELDWVGCLVGLGVIELGESRPQQLVQRAQQIESPVHWHLIGPLQRNKVRSILPLTTLIHSADSLRLLETIDRIAGELALRPRVLMEVNLSREAAKHGFQTEDLLAAWPNILQLKNVQIEGLMTMAAYSPNPENARSAFAGLRRLRDELQSRSAGTGVRLEHLSMGMTGDFEVAIEEGATLVRIGSALWEGLEARTPFRGADETDVFPP